METNHFCEGDGLIGIDNGSVMNGKNRGVERWEGKNEKNEMNGDE